MARPIDASVQVRFATGAATLTNSFTVFFREDVVDSLTMLDLNGLPMSELNGQPVPNEGNGKWDPRTVDTIDLEADIEPGLTMDELEEYSLVDLGRVADTDLRKYFSIQIVWGPGGTDILGRDFEGNGTDFLNVGDLDADTEFMALLDVWDNSWRARLVPLQTDTNFFDWDEQVFDTGEVADENALRRRKGRLYYEEATEDEDAEVIDFRTSSANYAEYRNRPFNSVTPVEGCQIFAEFTPGYNRFTGLVQGFGGLDFVLDKERTVSGESYKMTNIGTNPEQGVISNLVDFGDFTNHRIEFDIWYPQAEIEAGNVVELRIYDDEFGQGVPINLGNFTGDRWHHVKLYPREANSLRSGPYQLYWQQPSSGRASTWWLDNIKIIEETMKWEARAVGDDPWGDQQGEWTHARDLINSENSGILFPERGRELQVRGRALRPEVILGKVKVLPKYAELGRVVFEENQSDEDVAAGTTVTASTTNAGSTVGALVDTEANAQTWWESNGAGEQWVRIDLGAAWDRPIRRIEIDWDGVNYATSYLVESSPDGTTWTTRATETATEGGWHVIDFGEGINTRYFRIYGITRAGTQFKIFKAKLYPELETPTADFDTDVVGPVVEFTSTSTDPDGFLIAHIWQFGDGSRGFGPHVFHTYAETGLGYNVTLTVLDNHGNEAILTEEVGV